MQLHRPKTRKGFVVMRSPPVLILNYTRKENEFLNSILPFLCNLFYFVFVSREKFLKSLEIKMHNSFPNSYDFSDFGLTDSDTCKATIRMFFELNLVEKFHIPYTVSTLY